MLFYIRFAQFFVSPLLNKDSIKREIQAVDSGEARLVLTISSGDVRYFVYN